jgi:hypothetical protein
MDGKGNGQLHLLIPGNSDPKKRREDIRKSREVVHAYSHLIQCGKQQTKRALRLIGKLLNLCRYQPTTWLSLRAGCE